MSNRLRVKTLTKKKVLFRGGQIIDPVCGLNKKTDLVIVDGKIDSIGVIDSDSFRGEIIDVSGCWIVPGLIDMHVHLREPGREDKETIETGCRAAMAGGFTAVCCMANTIPIIDSRSHVEFIKERAAGQLVDVFPIPAVTKGMKGEELTEMGDLVDAGAVAFSDDGLPIVKASMMRRALEYAKMFGHPIIDHAEDPSLSEEGVMHEGFVSTTLGLRGIPGVSEEVHVARDILLTAFTGGPLHVAHVSSAESIRWIRDAKQRGVPVTAEVTPHHLFLNDEAVRTYDPNVKMKPPLRTEKDRQALIDALKDGTIDAVASDHAPHTLEDKETEFDAASFGIVGLETSVGLILNFLVKKKILTIEEVIDRMSTAPRRILGLPEIRIETGMEANLTVLDPKIEWKIEKSSFESKARNTPFDGWQLTGKSVGVLNHKQWAIMEPVGGGRK